MCFLQLFLLFSISFTKIDFVHFGRPGGLTSRFDWPVKIYNPALEWSRRSFASRCYSCLTWAIRLFEYRSTSRHAKNPTAILRRNVRAFQVRYRSDCVLSVLIRRDKGELKTYPREAGSGLHQTNASEPSCSHC